MDFLYIILQRLSLEARVFIVSMIPLIELRGAIPLGMAYGLNWVENFCVAVAGNLLPVPFVISFIRHVFEWMKEKNIFADLVKKYEERVMKKAEMVMKYSVIGLVLVVSIPLPGTGAWTGAVLAALLNMRLRYALPAITLGVIIAGFLVSGISYGFLGVLSSFFD